MSTYKMAIKEIIRFKKAFDKIDPRLPKKLVGDIGEFYVLNKLENLGFKRLRHKGRQAGFDIYIEEIDKKVEVRTSLLKNEGIYPEGINFWGWRVKNRNQKREVKFDVLVGVALDDDFIKPRFYIFTRDEALSVGDVKIGRFKNVQNKIHLFENNQSYKNAIKVKPKLVTKFEKYINEHRSEFLNKWNKIQMTM